MAEPSRWLRSAVVGLAAVMALSVGSRCPAQDMELAPPPTSDLESPPPAEYAPPPAADYRQAQPMLAPPPSSDLEAAQPEYDSGQDTE